uniref:Uncharacterized protein n=1 Tax=Anguilla anguilla TaxID=7936 RepID=A0A0E9UKB2_ANGAN
MPIKFTSEQLLHLHMLQSIRGNIILLDLYKFKIQSHCIHCDLFSIYPGEFY